MAISSQELIDRLREFTHASLLWCARESENSTGKVTDAIDMILEKTARVSQISDESRAAMEGIQKAISIHMGDHSRESLSVLIRGLEDIAHEHNEIQTLIAPIIQSLEFQDRLRQNLENMDKMLPHWIEFRKHVPDEMTEEELRVFGRELMKFTTMIAERDVIRKFIPGLEVETPPPDVVMF